jgi:hypothetical protein
MFLVVKIFLVSQTVYIQRVGYWWIINWKRSGREPSWPIRGIIRAFARRDWRESRKRPRRITNVQAKIGTEHFPNMNLDFTVYLTILFHNINLERKEVGKNSEEEHRGLFQRTLTAFTRVDWEQPGEIAIKITDNPTEILGRYLLMVTSRSHVSFECKHVCESNEVSCWCCLNYPHTEEQTVSGEGLMQQDCGECEVRGSGVCARLVLRSNNICTGAICLLGRRMLERRK